MVERLNGALNYVDDIDVHDIIARHRSKLPRSAMALPKNKFLWQDRKFSMQPAPFIESESRIDEPWHLRWQRLFGVMPSIEEKKLLNNSGNGDSISAQQARQIRGYKEKL